MDLGLRVMKRFGLVGLGWVSRVGFYGIPIIVGYLIPNPLYPNKQFYLKQFSLV